MIERVTRVLQSLFRNVIIITNTPEDYAFLQLPMFQDRIRGLGPLGGIYTAMSVLPGRAGFFVACDMPSLNRPLIRYMVEIRDDFDVVIPRISGQLESLHALYSTACLPAVERLIDAREYQVFRFFHEVSVRYVEETEVRRWDPHLRCFFNINRPEEVRAWGEP